MKISIRVNDGKRFRLLAPIWLIKSLLSVSDLGIYIARKYVSKEKLQYIESIDFRELKKAIDVLKAYKGLKLVDVKAKDGTEVTITI